MDVAPWIANFFFFFFIGQVDLGIHTLSSTQKSFDYTAETRLQVKSHFSGIARRFEED